MPNKTNIEWTDFTSQLIRYLDSLGRDVWACVKCSPGCAHCYSEAIAGRFKRGGPFNRATTEKVTPYFAEAEHRSIVRLKALAGKRVFIGDMTDVFGEWVPDELLDLMFATFAMRPDVTFQVLAKRADRMARYFCERDSHLAMTRQFVNFREYAEPAGPWPLPNVWLGVSCEDQQRADERIPELLKIPAAVRFLSMEPLLSAVDLSRHLGFQHEDEIGIENTDQSRPREQGVPFHDPRVRGIDWVIVGGESGPNVRPCDLAWIRSIVRQCKQAGAACFVKQLGGHPIEVEHCGLAPGSINDSAMDYYLATGGSEPDDIVHRLKLRDRKGGDWSEWPEDLRVREFPKGVA